jgi:hypothetical protein
MKDGSQYTKLRGNLCCSEGTFMHSSGKGKTAMFVVKTLWAQQG